MNKIEDLVQELKNLVEDTNTYVRVAGVNFFVQNFNRQGFLDDSLQPWKKRAFSQGGSILINSGALKRGVKGRSEGIDRVVFYVDSNIKYAQIHNEGGEITVTRKMQKYFWAMYLQSSGKVTSKKDGSASRSKRNVQLSSKAAFFKSMALKKVGSRIKIHKRQFIGESATLLNNYDKWLANEISKRF